MGAVVAVSLVAIAGCGGGVGETPAQPPAGKTRPCCWSTTTGSIVEMATAHGAFTIEVEMAEGVDTDEIARSLIQPLQDRYAEVLVYFHARDAQTDLPAAPRAVDGGRRLRRDQLPLARERPYFGVPAGTSSRR